LPTRSQRSPSGERKTKSTPESTPEPEHPAVATNPSGLPARSVIMQAPEKMARSIGTSRHDVPSDETQIAGAFLSLLKITDPVATSRPAPAATLVMEICGVFPSRPR